MTEPRTAAGRLFVAYEDANDEDAGNSLGHLLGIRHWTIRDVILAIEADAAALPASPDVEALARDWEQQADAIEAATEPKVAKARKALAAETLRACARSLRAAALPAPAAQTSGPQTEAGRDYWFAQGTLIHAPDRGGTDVGALIGEAKTDESARSLVERHNALVRREAEAQRLTVERLRGQIRALYDFHPDDSHGEGYRNSGVASALRVIEEAAGREFTDRCQRSDDYRKTAEVWCLTHGGPMGWRRWCDFAEKPWEWRDDGPLDPPAREEAEA